MTRVKLFRLAFTVVPCFCSLALLSGAASPSAGDLPVIEITAKRFAFAPDKITLTKGRTVKLRIHSEDVTHGFFLRPLKLDEEIPAGQTIEVTVTPQESGTFTLICDHFCGANHGNMSMTVAVE